VPAGSLEPGEPALERAMREAFEEAGLDAPGLVGLLGECGIDARAWGRNEIQHRWFVHVRCRRPLPAQWDQREEDPPDAPPGTRIRFRLAWARLGQPLPDLVPTFDTYLDEVRAALGIVMP